MTDPGRHASIVLAPAAVKDLDDAMTWWAERNPAVAETLRQTLDQVLDTLASGLLDGRASGLPSGVRCRRFYAHPFWIYYQRTPGVLRVLRIHHHARAPLT